MTPEESERVMDLFAAALACATATERTALLARACPDDDDDAVRAEVESLLRVRTATPGFLDKPLFTRGARLLADDMASGGGGGGELRPGDTLGDCRVVSLLGVGGMGEVYLADDTTLGRRVALKLLLPQGRGDARLRHFRHERKVLAGLNHPHIARLYGGAVTPEGRPYLVMEYVEGERLDDFCQRHALGVPARLALFRKVCAAVAYAHQNLIIHRDLKPANIRVTPEGEPKLLDFGIAKLLDPEHTATASATATDALPTPTLTLTLQGMMTPEYASPEQLRGEAITTASDVYSLGVVLFELLTGQRPYHLKGRRPDEVIHTVCETEPARASAVAARTTGEPAGSAKGPPLPAGKLRRALAGDLDNIVARALRKEPSRRYGSAALLSEDLRRHLAGVPVQARPDTLPYRAGKFLRRNKAGVAAAALVALALVGGLVSTAREARRANRRFDDVRRLANSILFEIEPQIARLSGSMKARQFLVQSALEYLDGLAAEAGNEPGLRRELAVAYRKVGDIQGNPSYSNLGDLKGALASYQKAMDLLQAIAAADDRDWQARDELAKLHQQIGAALQWADRKDEALQHRQTALALRRKLLAGQPRSVELRRELMDVLMDVGDWYEDCFALPKALAAYHEALPLARAVAAEPPEVPEDRVNVARLLVRVSKVHKDAADYPAAMDDLAQAAAIVTPLAQGMPHDRSVQLENWYIAHNQLRTATKQSTKPAAAEFGSRAVGLAQALVAANPGDAAVEHDLVTSLEDDFEALNQAKRWPEALAAARSAWEISERLAARSPETSYYTSDCIYTRCAMGQARLNLGDNVAATGDAQAAQGMVEGEFAKTPDDPDLRKMEVSICELLGDLCEGRAEPTQARGWYQRALAQLQILTDKKQISDNEAPDFRDQFAKFTAKLTPADGVGKTTLEATRSNPGATAPALPTP